MNYNPWNNGRDRYLAYTLIFCAVPQWFFTFHLSELAQSGMFIVQFIFQFLTGLVWLLTGISGVFSLFVLTPLEFIWIIYFLFSGRSFINLDLRKRYDREYKKLYLHLIALMFFYFSYFSCVLIGDMKPFDAY